DKDITEILAALRKLEVKKCPCTAGAIPKGKGHHWVRPELVVEVKYKEMTDQGLARQPSFERLRTDKPAREVVVESLAIPEEELPEPEEIVEERVVPFSNLDKVFWPEEGHTKGDLIEYHRQVA